MKQHFKEQCIEYQDVFLVHLSNICKTRLVTIDIYTGDFPLSPKNPMEYHLNMLHGYKKNLNY